MKYMMLAYIMLSLFACAHRPDTSHLEKDLLHLEAKIPLPGVSGRIDHLAYDSAGGRLFVAALGNNTVEVVDLSTHSIEHTIAGLHEPQGVQYLPGQHRLIVANGSNGSCIFYDGHSFSELTHVELGDDADNVRYDGKEIYVGHGSGGIAVIDPATMKQVGDLPLKGHPESFQLGDSGRIYINVPDEGEIVVADQKTLEVIKIWKNSGASANFPMALDPDAGRLYVAYRHPPQLRTVSSSTGAVLASAACVGDADDVFCDTASSLIFVSGGAGYLDIFRKGVLVNHLATRRGARTGLWLPAEKKFILAVPARGSEDAALWVYAM